MQTAATRIETGLEFKKLLVKNEAEEPEEAVEIKPEIKSEKTALKKPDRKEKSRYIRLP